MFYNTCFFLKQFFQRNSNVVVPIFTKKLTSNNINKVIAKEKIDLLLISFGGCCSNSLTDVLEANGYTIRTQTYCDFFCHMPTYIDHLSVPVIYLYTDPIKAFLSQKRRGVGFYDVNQQKLSNNKDAPLSDDNLLTLMIRQFHSFTGPETEEARKSGRLLILQTKEIFSTVGRKKIEDFLGKRVVTGLPLNFVEGNVKEEKIQEIKILLEKKEEINEINKWKCL